MSNFKYRKYSLKTSNSQKLQKINPYKFYIVYKTVNLLNLKEYIGTHCSNYLTDDYMGSGVELKRDIEELGIENFKRINIHVFYNHHDMVECERQLVDLNYLSRPDTYNIAKGGANIGCTDVDNKYLDKIRKKCIDYSVDDYSKLIDHLCILRNELIYFPSIKKKQQSFESVAFAYKELNDKLNIELSRINKDNSLIEEMREDLDNIRGLHDTLDDVLNYISIEDVHKTGCHTIKSINRAENIKKINECRIEMHNMNLNGYYTLDFLISLAADMIKKYDINSNPKMSFINTFYDTKKSLKNGVKGFTIGDKK